MNHCCCFNELSTIVSYTPQPRYLDYTNLKFNPTDIEIISPIILSNLTYCFLCTYELKYEDFEKFISQFNTKIKVFTLTTLSKDILYFNANRWEKIIREYLLDLKEFCFLYHEYIDIDYQSSIDLGESNQFLSPFWIERHLGLEVTSEHKSLAYSVCQYE